MPTQVSKLVRMLKIFDEEAIDKFEALIESIVVIIEEGDLKSLEETISDIVEAGLFGVTVLQPNLLLALFMIMQIIITGAATLVERDMVGEEEAFTRARNICGKIWRSYGEVGGQSNLLIFLTHFIEGLSWSRVDRVREHPRD